jgi:hypothetical protein
MNISKAKAARVSLCETCPVILLLSLERTGKGAEDLATH